MINVSVSTLSLGTNEPISLPSVQFRLASERLKVSEIIQRAVKSQIEQCLQAKLSHQEIHLKIAKQYLTPSEIRIQVENGKIGISPKKIVPKIPDVDAEIKRVLVAFSARQFKLFVDAEPMIELDDICILKENSSIQFIRIMPLIGG